MLARLMLTQRNMSNKATTGEGGVVNLIIEILKDKEGQYGFCIKKESGEILVVSPNYKGKDLILENISDILSCYEYELKGENLK